MFNLDHISLSYQLIWRIVRTTLNANFISAATHPLIKVYNDLIVLRSKTNYDLQFTGQVIYLQQILNDKFDSINRQIYISDVANIAYSYVYTDIESPTPTYVYTDAEPFNDVYIDTDSEQISNQQFIINIPATGINLYELKAIVNRYKLAGKNYIIVTF